VSEDWVRRGGAAWDFFFKVGGGVGYEGMESRSGLWKNVLR